MPELEIAAEVVSTFLRDAGIQMVDVRADIFTEVLVAYSRYGKGTGHAAKLNLGDCFAYAMAKRDGSRLLFKGNDFSHTDIVPA